MNLTIVQNRRFALIIFQFLVISQFHKPSVGIMGDPSCDMQVDALDRAIHTPIRSLSPGVTSVWLFIFVVLFYFGELGYNPPKISVTRNKVQ